MIKDEDQVKNWFQYMGSSKVRKNYVFVKIDTTNDHNCYLVESDKKLGDSVYTY